jgi:copper chaperone
MNTIKLNVNGMSCEHCAKSIKNGLLDKNGVAFVEVSLKENTVKIDYSDVVISVDEIRNVIEEIGYDVI